LEEVARQQDEEWGSPSGVTEKQAEALHEILGRVPVFEELDRDELRQIERIVHRRTYRPQETIVRQGAPGVGMYIIQSGTATVLLESGDGQVIRLAELSDGQFFGEMSLLDESPRSASVAASDRSEVIGFFRADLMGIIAQSPRLGLKIVSRLNMLMARRLQETLLEYREAQAALRILRE